MLHVKNKDAIDEKKHKSTASLPQYWEKARKSSKSWFRGRTASEKRLVLIALGIAVSMGLYSSIEFGIQVFSEQRARLTELEKTMGSLPPLIHQLHRLEEQKLTSLERFSKAARQQAVWSHLDALLKKSGQDKLDGNIQRLGDSNKAIGEDFIQHSFTVTFQKISQEDLADFLKRLSSDEKRPAVITKMTLTGRGSSLNVVVSLDIITRRV